MDDPAFKSKYQKYKYRVKLWEHDFKKKFGRVPSKYDIREAQKDIRDSYRMYYKMKTSLLEDTLNDVFCEDGFDILDGSQGDITIDDEQSTNGPVLPFNISNIDFGGSTSFATNSFSNLEDIKNNAIDIQNIVNVNDDHVIKNFEPIETLKQNESAWIDCNPKKKTPPPKKSISPAKPTFKSNLNASLFKSSSFSKRNPRKSIVRTNSDILNKTPSSNDFNDSKEVLPDLETILSQKAKEQAATPVATPMLQKSREISTDIDRAWLDRCTTENAIGELPQNIHINAHKVSKPKLGISNLNIEKLRTAVNTSISVNSDPQQKDDGSDSVVSDSDDDKESQSYRHVAKRRRILTTIDRNQIVSPQESIHAKVEEQVKPNVSAVIPNVVPEPASKRNRYNFECSDDSDKDPDFKTEEKPARKSRKKTEKSVPQDTDEKPIPVKKERKKKIPAEPKEPKAKRPTARAKRRVVKKVEIEEEEEEEKPIDYPLPIDTENVMTIPRVNMAEMESVANSYINTITTGSGPSVTNIESGNEARLKDRSKLETKMKSGQLNENFVTINLRKKVFVRGKKNVNFSSYKKKQWKAKKAGALAGPEMDMRGCDGGVLTCFQCGQPGHFAAKCPVKGDSLLPSNAEVDDASPFPTLEEAQEMATQKALVVHSRNIENLPASTNSLLYKSDTVENDEDDEEYDIPEGEFDTDFNLEEDLEGNATSQDADESLLATPIQSPFVGHKIPEDFLKKAGMEEIANENASIGPLYNLDSDGSVIATTDEVNEALRMFGHSNFRKGQDKAIMRILSGQSTLVTLSTGSGKSLCYQLPAYLYSRKKKSITLVISPLVSLMEDQVHGVPHFLHAHCLHTNQTPQQRMKVLEMINNGEVDILLVSPEAVCAGERSTGFGSILRKLPPIAFACIDEAHCVSQWSHNFRPSYLMICKVLKNNLGIKTILGLTATATLPTRTSIIKHLGIPDGEHGIISDIPLPDNLLLSISKDENKDSALMQLLRSKRFEGCQSIIIYCTRRDECERIAGLIRTCMQDKRGEEPVSTNKRRRINWQAEPYHAGMPSSRRRTIQNAFMKNELRIVVATIAFGMGINKPDIRAVLHYNMPRNFESYVQEIGRAGRDGKISHCHLFLDPRGNDQNELRRHIYANSIDRHVIRKLLQKIFVACSCGKGVNRKKMVEGNSERIRVCGGHEIGISSDSTVLALDIPAENISTLLCYLELDIRWSINVLSNAYIMAKVISYSGAKGLKQAAKECPPLAMAIAIELKKGTFDENSNVIEFCVIDIAAAIGWNSGIVKHQLKQLEWTTVNGYPKRSSITISYFDLGFRLKAPGDFTPDEIDEALDCLYNRSVQQEKTQLIQLQYVFDGLSKVSFKSCLSCTEEDYGTEKSEELKKIVRDYFQNDYPKDLKLNELKSDVHEDVISNDVRIMINMYPENNFTGRSLARIFHGIQSPNFTAIIWSRCKYWRAYCNVDFNYIVRVANMCIIKMRTC